MKLKWNSAWKSHNMVRERPHKCDHTLNVVVTKLVTKKWSYYRYIYTYISQKLIGLNWIFFILTDQQALGSRLIFRTMDSKLTIQNYLRIKIQGQFFAAEFKSAISISLSHLISEICHYCVKLSYRQSINTTLDLSEVDRAVATGERHLGASPCSQAGRLL